MVNSISTKSLYKKQEIDYFGKNSTAATWPPTQVVKLWQRAVQTCEENKTNKDPFKFTIFARNNGNYTQCKVSVGA